MLGSHYHKSGCHKLEGRGLLFLLLVALLLVACTTAEAPGSAWGWKKKRRGKKRVVQLLLLFAVCMRGVLLYQSVEQAITMRKCSACFAHEIHSLTRKSH